MLEVSLRLLAAIGFAAASYATGAVPFDFGWRAALVFAAYSGFGFLIERRGFRQGGIAGLLGLMDATVLSAALAQAGVLSSYGMLVVVPVAYAVRRFGTNPLHLAAPSAATILLADNLFGNGGTQIAPLLAHVLAVLAVGLLLAAPATAQSPEETPETERAEAEPTHDDLLIRERFRQVRDAYRDLEQRTRRDRFVAELWETPMGAGCERGMAKLLAHYAKCDRLVLYSLDQLEGAMVVTATVGDVPSSLQDASQRVEIDSARASIKDQLHRSVRSLLDETNRERAANVLLISKGQVVGLVTLLARQPEDREESVRVLEELAEPAAEAMIRAREDRRLRRERDQMRLLYDLATDTDGSPDAAALTKRVVEAIRELTLTDDAGIFSVQDGEPVLLAGDGLAAKLLGTMSFASGPGFEGWVGTGCPELWLPVAAEDSRCPEASRFRVGSLYVAPIGAQRPAGAFLAVSTRRAHALGLEEAETLRLVCLELGRRLFSSATKSKKAAGLLAPEDFRKLVSAGEGHLVHLEVLRWESYGDDCGEEELRKSLRQLARRMARSLPAEGALTVGKVGMVAYLPAGSGVDPSGWASEAAATAPLVAVKKFDGSKRPLAVRARTAAMAQQRNRAEVRAAA